MAILGIDIDGVLANFTKGFRQRLIDVTGRDLVPESVCQSEAQGPPCWDWVEHYGYTKDEESKTWADALADPQFWYELSAYPHTSEFLGQTAGHDRYFITSRPGYQAKRQTERWLDEFGVEFPTVLIGGSGQDKGLIAQGLGVTHFLDDRPINCYWVREYADDAHVYLVDASYNREIGTPSFNRLATPLDLLKELG